MEKMRSNPENEMPQDLRRFYSHDPYEVLGVPSTASSEEIKQAWRKVQRKFHPDVSKEPRAVEISQNINVAYDTLTNKRSGVRGGARTETHRQSRPPEYGAGFGSTRSTHRETRQESTKEEIEGKFLFNLKYEASDFAKWVSDAKAVGITQERIQELLKSEQAQKIIKNRFVQKVTIWGKDGSGDCLKYVEEWRTAGIELKDYFNLPEIKDFLVNQAINIKIKIWGEQDPSKFLEFVESWKKAGIDLSRVVESPKAMEYLTNRAIGIYIKIWGEDDANKFLEFVREWRKAGVELKDLVNSSAAQKILEDRARSKLKIWGKEKFKSFVQVWIKAGWKPSAEITSTLEKA